jgi:hypothetical protein
VLTIAQTAMRSGLMVGRNLDSQRTR